jgi:hypothetical protein
VSLRVVISDHCVSFGLSMIFEYVRVLFYADYMKLFLPVKSFQDYMRFQYDLNKLSEWCERNLLFLTEGCHSSSEIHTL